MKKSLVIGIVLAVFLFGMIGGVCASLVYVENPNSVSCSGGWDSSYPCSNAYDGSWELPGARASSEASYYFNYTRPIGALMVGASGGTANMSQVKLKLFYLQSSTSHTWNLFPFNADVNCFRPISQFRLRGSSSSSGFQFSCWNGASWVDVGSPHYNVTIIEVAMLWNVPCPANQTILKLNSQNNAHGALWNDTSYTYNLCYSHFFGFEYGGANPHECTSSNKVVNLWSSTNAHAENPSLNNYNIPVCYGDLNCVARENSCQGEEVLLLSLNNWTNAHISLGDDENYNIKICCANTPLESEANWTNTMNEVISFANLSDTVKLRVVNFGGSNGNEYNMSIYRGNGASFIENVTGSVIGGDLIGIWNVNSSLGLSIGDKLTFKVDDLTSNELKVFGPSNSPMNITLISPECGSYYVNGTEQGQTLGVNISVMAVDTDDIINGTIRLGSQTVSFSNGETNVTIPIVQYGNLAVVVEATNNRSEYARLVTSIMLIEPDKSLDRRYVAACIDEPKDLSNLPTGNVWFNASSTIGYRYNMSVGGNNVPFEIDKDKMIFHWTFSEGTTTYVEEGSNSKAYRFYKSFNSAGKKSANLQVMLKD